MATSKKFDELYKKLNSEQKQAVDHIDRPVLVVAGPGTGKTQVLTMRVANILLKTDVPADAVLALTFTESGVRAMRERLLSIISTAAYYVSIHTFHSFASDIIKAHPDEFIFSTQMEPLSDLERVHIFKSIFDELDLKQIKPFNSQYFYLQTAISKIKDLKREGIDTTEYSDFISEATTMDAKDQQKNLELIQVYNLYQQKLKEYGRYDFEDMINFVVDKFKNSPSLLAQYQERFQYFLVDEFQDTNSAQAELLYQLSSYWDPDPNLFVVGDDDQSIYRFQGASIENILTFTKKYPNAHKVALTKNYRSVQPILDAAQSLIINNKMRISSTLKIIKDQDSQVSEKDKSSKSKKINFGEFSSSHTENHYIATEIKKLIDNGIKPSEIAIIYRNNSDSIDIAEMLSRFGINYTLEGGENVLESGIIIRLLHLFRVISKIRTKDEDLDLFTLLNYEFLEMNPLDILRLSRFASSRKINFFEAIQHDELETSNISDIAKLIEFYEKLILWNEMGSNMTFIEFFEKVLEESGFLNWVLNQSTSYEYLNKLNSFLSEIQRLNYTEKNLTLEQFLKYIDLMQENKISINESTLEVQSNAVKLTTAHKAKGLEFEYVFVPKFVDKKWSNVITRDLIKLPKSILKSITDIKDKEIQEEDDRRLFFVVLTRAKKQIYLTSAKSYQSAAYQKDGTPSMFAHEISEKFIEKIEIEKYESDVSKILKEMLKPRVVNNNIEKNEKEFLTEALKNFKLSASSLNTYLECAYKFKLEYLFKTPQPKERPLVLGITVHKALEMAYKNLKMDGSVSLEYILEEFNNSLKSEILNDEEFIALQKEGSMVITNYYLAYEEEFNKNNGNILFIEKFFGWGWSKPLLDNEIHLQGKVDKIELIRSDPTAKSGEVRVTDYKTGRPKSRNEIQGQTKYATGDQYRQLIFYKLLLELDNTFNFKVTEVELDFIGHRNAKPKREKFVISESDVDDLKKIIRETAKSINDLKFERTTNYAVCQRCRFKYHCWPDGIPAVSNTQLDLL